MAKPRYFFGPLGRLMAVDVPPGGFSATGREVAALQYGLSGRATKDVFGYKRAWSIPLSGLDPGAESWFRMCHEGAVGPLYLLDERDRNRLSSTASTTGSVVRRGQNFSPLGYAVTAHDVDLLTCLTPDGPKNSPAPIRALTWTGLDTLTAEPVIPVVPGEALVFSAYVLDGDPTLEVVPYDRDLVALAPVGGTAVQGETPERRYVTYTVAAGVAAVKVRMTGTDVQTVAWQLETGLSPSPWTMGHHPPRVLVESMPTSRRELGQHIDGTIQLVEV